MKSIMWGLLALMICVPSGWAAEEVPPSQAQAVAYFEALTTADTEKANKLVAVPYSLDRKKVLTTQEEVEAIHAKIAERKGKREIPKYTVSKADKAPALDKAVFPEYEAFRIQVGDKEAIDIYVSTGETPRVIGFTD